MLGETGAERLAALRAQMEASLRQWTAQTENLQTCVRNPTESERVRQRRPGAAAKRYAELAEDFKSPLTVICTAGAGLLQTQGLSPEQRELAESIETASVRLRELLHAMVDTSRVKTRRTAGASHLER
jgi:signal transduction histidine kinase